MGASAFAFSLSSGAASFWPDFIQSMFIFSELLVCVFLFVSRVSPESLHALTLHFRVLLLLRSGDWVVHTFSSPCPTPWLAWPELFASRSFFFAPLGTCVVCCRVISSRGQMRPNPQRVACVQPSRVILKASASLLVLVLLPHPTLYDTVALSTYG